ncbi:MAG: InlB B-repeat-containing protein [Clostridia bacterium]|nr:InlB B-repeat-containing protein [Clostridia bacterium]
MSNFKRILSAFMAVLMVLGMFSCLSTIGFAGSTDHYVHHSVKTTAINDNWSKTYTDYTASQNNNIKLYSELTTLYGNDYNEPFIYYGIQFFEPATAAGSDTIEYAYTYVDSDNVSHTINYWTPTDHKVQPGEFLLGRYYFKTNAYIGSMQANFFFSRKFFDLAPSQEQTYTASYDYPTDATETLYTPDGLTNKTFTVADGSAHNPNGPFYASFAEHGVDVSNPKITLARAARKDSQLKGTKNPPNYGLSYDTTYGWDVAEYYCTYTYPSGTANAEKLCIPIDENVDEYFGQWVVKVREEDEPTFKGTANPGTVNNVTPGTVGYVGYEEGYQKGINSSASNAVPVVTDSSANMLKTSAKDPSVTGITYHLDTEDANHIFVIDNGSTPSQGNNIKFYDGENEITDLRMTNQTGSAVDISGKSATKEGLTFAGWKDANGNLVTTVDASSGDVSVYAKWNAVATFTAPDANPAWTSQTQTVEAVSGATFTAPSPAPTKSGSVFAGWYVQGDATQTLVTFPAAATANTTYVAKFSQQYTISFYDRGTLFDTQTGLEGATISFPTEAQLLQANSNDGYTLTGWSPADTVINSTTSRYDAVWSEKGYTVYYNTDGAGTIANGNFVYGATITDPSPAPTKTGYQLAGWSYYEDAAYSIPYSGGTMPAKDLYAKASWTANNYPVTFTVDGAEDTSLATTAAYNSNITMPQLPTKAGYYYEKWLPDDGYRMDSTSGKAYSVTGQAMPQQATFKNGNTTIDSQYFNTDAAVTFPSEADVAAHGGIPNGMTFKGWSRGSGANAVFIPKENATDTMPPEDTVYSAVFEGTPYNLTIYVDGEQYGEVLSVNYGAILPLPELTPPTGYHWGDWQGVPADGLMPNSNLTVSINSVINQYSIIVKDGDTGAVIDTITDDYNAPITAPALSTYDKTGFTTNSYSKSWPATMPLDGDEITVLYTRNDYKIKYNLGLGLDPVEVSYAYEAPIAEYVPTTEGYTFDRWNPEVPATMPAASQANAVAFETTAVWNIHKWTIEYQTKQEGGSYGRYGTVETNVEYDSAIQLRGKKTETGYTYSDWSASPDTYVAPPANMPDSDLVLYSTGTKNTYVDKWFDLGADPATDEPYHTETVAYGDTIPTVALPPHAGQVDPYWEANVTVTNNIQPDEAVIFVYKSTAGQVNYSLVYSVQQLDGTYVDEEPIILTATAGSTVSSAPYQTREGFTCNAQGTDASIVVAGDGSSVMHVKLDRASFNIIVKVDGLADQSTAYLYGAAISEPAEPTVEGKTFKDWKYTKGATTQVISFPATMPAYDITATAQFDDNSYTLTAYVDYLDGNGFVPFRTVSYTHGQTIATVANQNKEYYDFTGWKTTSALDTDYVFGTPATGNVDIYASFTPKEYTLIFKKMVNGDDQGQFDSITEKYGVAITYPAAPEVAGNSFTGWSAEYATMPGGGGTVYAYYGRVQRTLTFDVDGKTTIQKYYMGDTIVPIANPTKTGYVFDGWNPALPDPLVMPDENLTVTATWRLGTFTVTFIANPEDVENTTTTSQVQFNDEFNAPASVDEREGFNFVGWKVQGTQGSNTVTFPYKLETEGITFVGVWSQDLSATLVQHVQRATDPKYYQLGETDYTVTIKTKALKLHITDGTTTWTYSKPTFYNAPEVSGIKSITYNDQTGEEIWVISAALAAGENLYKAYITTMDFTEYDPSTGYVFSVIYDERDAQTIATECTLNSVESTAFAENTYKLVRGNYVTWTVTTTKNVTWLKFDYDYTSTKDEVTKNYSVLYKRGAQASDNLTITENENNLVWVIRTAVTYTTSDQRVTQNWKLSYKTGATSDYIAVNEASPVQLIVCRNSDAMTDTSPNYDKYTIVSAKSAVEGSVKLGTRSGVEIVTTDDCNYVRITVDGKSATFQRTSANTTVTTDGMDQGLIKWTINYKFAPKSGAGQYEVTCNARGPRWDGAESFNIVVTA